MSKKKEMFLVIDTETANSVDEPLPYDIGYAICDRNGNITLKRSFIVAEVFCDMQDLMQSAYYADKIPIYWDKLKKGEAVMKSIFNIRKQIKADIKEYNVKTIAAYNMSFDKRALNNSIRYHSKSFIRWFFPFGLKYICIWTMACETLLQQKTFFKKAVKNDWVSEKGNLITNAEVTYNYIKRTTDFKEEHTGLADVEIEIEIMAHCFRQHKKMSKTINRQCWRLPQKTFKEWAEKDTVHILKEGVTNDNRAVNTTDF